MQSTDIKVNEFTTRTWNRLGINYSVMPLKIEACPKPTISALPQGITLLSERPNKAEATAEGGLGVQFNEAYNKLLQSGVVPTAHFLVEGSDEKPPVTIQFKTERASSACVDISIYAKEGATGTFILRSDGSVNEAIGSRLTLFANSASFVTLIFVNMVKGSAICFDSVETHIAKDARVNMLHLALGAQKTFLGVRHMLEEKNAACNIKSVWYAGENREIDISYTAEHRGEHTKSEATFDGIIAKGGKKAWKGTIDFKNACANSAGNEKESVLLLSEQVENKSMPVILCAEESVEGHHGSSIGQLSPSILMYMASRGIDYATARAMLIKSRITAVSRLIPDESLVANIQDYVEGAF